MFKHRWWMDKSLVCRCKNCGKLWTKENRFKEDCEVEWKGWIENA